MKLIQLPNLSLIIAALGFVASKATNGIVHKLGSVVFTVAIIIWAYQEISSGINWFRKLLGVAILTAISFSLFKQLH